MIHKFIMCGVAAAACAVTACNAEKSGNGATATATGGPVEAVPAPNGGDWSTVVAQTPEGGFVMGNPNAAVKLIEFGSMTCPHCREFDETGMKPLTDQYVKTGKVSFEFRNYVRDGYDMAASVVARCGGPSSFFGLTRQLYTDQPEWIAKIQGADPAQMQAIAALAPNQQLAEVAKIAGFPQWAAMRGLPATKTAACLADPEAPTKLVQMQADATTAYPDLPGTPSFILNGKMIEIKAGSTPWSQVETALKEAIGG
ncbi:MAG: DsbA family protein [Sphingomonas bacterium]|nr:DsbA family protein [Sphingomonas bacterium]